MPSTLEPPPDDLRARRAGLRAKRAALSLVIGVAVIFIGASAAQIVPAIFGLGVRPMQIAGAHDSQSGPAGCARGVSARLHAVEAAVDRPRPPRAPDARAPGDPWPDEAQVRAACATSADGLDTWASLARLRVAVEQLRGARDPVVAVAPMVHDVEAHLPPDLR